MNQSLASIALVSLVGLFVAACSGAQDAEHESDVVDTTTALGTTTQAETVSDGCGAFSVAGKRSGRVCTYPDPDDIHGKVHCGIGLVDTCTAETAPPAAPAGSADKTPQSCTDLHGTVVSPPVALSACTDGYTFVYQPGLEVQAFLCPIALAQQAQAGTLLVTLDSCTQTLAGALTPDNGCFGAPLDPTSWGYVELVNMRMQAPRCGKVNGNCGAECMVNLGPTVPSLPNEVAGPPP